MKTLPGLTPLETNNLLVLLNKIQYSFNDLRDKEGKLVSPLNAAIFQAVKELRERPLGVGVRTDLIGDYRLVPWPESQIYMEESWYDTDFVAETQDGSYIPIDKLFEASGVDITE